VVVGSAAPSVLICPNFDNSIVRHHRRPGDPGRLVASRFANVIVVNDQGKILMVRRLVGILVIAIGPLPVLGLG
jgi:hypothetical protein